MGSLGHFLKSRRDDVILAASLFLFFVAAYLIIGLPLLGPLTSHHLTVAGADSEEVIALLARYEEWYYKTGRHPLVVILLNPFGQILNLLTGSEELSSLLLNVICGASLPVLFFAVLRKIGLTKTDATLFSVFLGISASYLIYSSIPETYVFSAFSVLALFAAHVFCSDNKTFLAWFVPLSVISFGMALPNLAPITIVLFFRYRELRLPRRILLLAAANVGVIALTACLALVQRVVYNNPDFFLASAPVTDPSAFYTYDLFTRPVPHFLKYAPDYFVHGVIARRGVSTEILNFSGYVTGDQLAMFFFVDRAPWFRQARLAWILLAVSALVAVVRYKVYRHPALLIFGAYLLTNVVFHLIYDPEEIFLFSPSFTFAWIALVAIPFGSLRGNVALACRALLVLALALAVINNALFIENVWGELRIALSELPPTLGATR